MTEWNFDSLKELMDERDRRYAQLASATDKAVQAALAAAKDAVMEAKHNSDKWQENSNEWRAAMNDKDRNYVTKAALWGYFGSGLALILIIVELLQRLRVIVP